MKYNNGLVISTIALTLIMTGCVKKADTAPAVYDNPQPVYDTSQVMYDTAQPTTTTTYETAAPIVYEENVNSSAVTYSEAPIDNTVITTGTSYGAVVDTGVSYSQPVYSEQPVSVAPVATVDTGNSAYSNPYGGSSSSSTQSYSNPYGSGGVVSDYPEPATNTYSSSSSTSHSSYGSSSTSQSSGGGIHLQIAALKNYYAAKEFKNSLSLDPKYTAYIKRGAINKVIIKGISSIAEVNRLKERRFPGSFIVSGGSSYSSSTSSYSAPSSSASSSYSGGGYTDNNPYGNPSSYGNSASSSSSSNSGVGVQIGAYSSKSKAQSVANSSGGRYKAVVSKGVSQGRTIYRVVLTGFSSRAAAKRALASGQIQNGFVTSNY